MARKIPIVRGMTDDTDGWTANHLSLAK